MMIKYTSLKIIGLALALLTPFSLSYAIPDPVEEAAKAYGLAKGAEALTNLPAASRAIASTGGTLPYQGGNNTLRIAANMAEDYKQHIADFHWPNPLGRDWAWDGICIRLTPRPRFSNLIRYRYPMIMAEQSTLFRGEYVPDTLMSLYADFYDNFYEKVADDEAGREIKRTQSIMSGSWSPVPEGGGPGMNKSILTSAPESFRKRGGMQSAGARGLNYHLFLTTAGLLNFPKALWGNCHRRPPPITTLPGVLHSNNPLFMDPTHLNMWSDILFTPQMAALYNSPSADFPVANTCVIHNIMSGKSPASTLAGVVEKPAAGVSKPRALCVEGVGARFPITTRLHNVRSPYNAARLALLRSTTFFRASPFTPMIDFAYFRAGTEREDHIQFHHPPILSSEIGSIRKNTHFTDDGYVGGNFEPDPNRTVLTVWKWVRCCRRGRPFIVWSGDKSQYRGMHQFSGGRYP